MDDPTPTFYRNRQVGLDAPSVNTAPLFYEGKEFFRNPAGGFIPVSTSLRPF
jgi:hypothetical protein